MIHVLPFLFLLSLYSYGGDNCSDFLEVSRAEENFLRTAVKIHPYDHLSSIDEIFTTLSITRSTSDPEILKDKFGLTKIESKEASPYKVEVSYSQKSPALFRLSYSGLQIYTIDKFNNKIETLSGNWFSLGAPRGFVNGDKVGPTNLRIHQNDDGSTIVFYTNARYLYSVKIEKDGRTSNLDFDYFGHSEEGYFKRILYVDLRLGLGRTMLYAAELDKFGNVGLFWFDEKGKPQFLNGYAPNIRDKALLAIAREINAENIYSISDLVRMPNALRVFGLTTEHLGHFKKNDPLLKPGQPYNYVMEGTGY
jgi:hypothetical protein